MGEIDSLLDRLATFYGEYDEGVDHPLGGVIVAAIVGLCVAIAGAIAIGAIYVIVDHVTIFVKSLGVFLGLVVLGSIAPRVLAYLDSL